MHRNVPFDDGNFFKRRPKRHRFALRSVPFALSFPRRPPDRRRPCSCRSALSRLSAVLRLLLAMAPTASNQSQRAHSPTSLRYLRPKTHSRTHRCFAVCSVGSVSAVCSMADRSSGRKDGRGCMPGCSLLCWAQASLREFTSISIPFYAKRRWCAPARAKLQSPGMAGQIHI